MRILIAEDDAHIAAGIQNILAARGHAVDCVTDGRTAEAAARSGLYHLVIMDIGLPQLDGAEVIRRLRAAGLGMPVIVVSAAHNLADRVRLLDLGADDYLVKPFAIAEFEARVRAQLRRATTQGTPELQVGKLRLAQDGDRAWCGDTPLDLTAREMALAQLLASRAQRIVNRGQLIEAVCRWDEELSDNGLDIAMHRLRRKLNGCGVRLKTVRGLGYLLEAADDGAD